jgi:hypothetical protein
VDLDESFVKVDERLVKVVERLKTRNGGAFPAWEPRLHGSLKTEKDGRAAGPRPPPSAQRGVRALRVSVSLVAERRTFTGN